MHQSPFGSQTPPGPAWVGLTVLPQTPVGFSWQKEKEKKGKENGREQEKERPKEEGKREMGGKAPDISVKFMPSK